MTVTSTKPGGVDWIPVESLSNRSDVTGAQVMAVNHFARGSVALVSEGCGMRAFEMWVLSNKTRLRMEN